MNNTKWYWIRWIAVLPAAIIASILFRYLFYYIQLFNSGESTYFLRYILSSISAMCSAYGFISIGTKVAPTNKRKVALVLFILFLIFLAATLFQYLVNGQYIVLITIVGSLVGLIGTFIYERKKNQN